MPRWKPKTTKEKFAAELKKLEVKITSKRADLSDLETSRQQLEIVLSALEGKPDATIKKK